MNEPELGIGINPGMAFNPFPSSNLDKTRQDSNPQPLDRESSPITTRSDLHPANGIIYSGVGTFLFEQSSLCWSYSFKINVKSLLLTRIAFDFLTTLTVFLVSLIKQVCLVNTISVCQCERYLTIFVQTAFGLHCVHQNEKSKSFTEQNLQHLGIQYSA
jgi:hypothetical protein